MTTHDTALNTFYGQFVAVCKASQGHDEDIADFNRRYLAPLEILAYSHNPLSEVAADKELQGLDKLRPWACYIKSPNLDFRTFTEVDVHTEL